MNPAPLATALLVGMWSLVRVGSWVGIGSSGGWLRGMGFADIHKLFFGDFHLDSIPDLRPIDCDGGDNVDYLRGLLAEMEKTKDLAGMNRLFSLFAETAFRLETENQALRREIELLRENARDSKRES